MTLSHLRQYMKEFGFTIVVNVTGKNLESAKNKLSGWLEPTLSLKKNEHLNLESVDLTDNVVGEKPTKKSKKKATKVDEEEEWNPDWEDADWDSLDEEEDEDDDDEDDDEWDWEEEDEEGDESTKEAVTAENDDETNWDHLDEDDDEEEDDDGDEWGLKSLSSKKTAITEDDEDDDDWDM